MLLAKLFWQDSMCGGIFMRFSTESGTPIAQNHEHLGPRCTFDMEVQDANTMVSRFFHHFSFLNLSQQ